MSFFPKTVTLIVFILSGLATSAQVVQIKGTVYDRSARFGMEGVSVMATSGTGAVTDSLGRYIIRLPYTDSLSFSYQGKATQKFPVKTIPLNRPFDISMHVDIKVLPTVEIKQNVINYHTDSLAMREEYRKVFNYEREYFTSNINGASGLNLDLLFSMKKIKRMEHFRKNLQIYEQEKYVDYRFNKTLVTKLTGLKDAALDGFMIRYRPTYETLMSFDTEYEYYEYIKYWGLYYARTHQ